MKSRKEKLSYLRKKDFISILITTVTSALIFIFLKRYFLATSEVSIFSYIGFLGAIIVVNVYSKDKLILGNNVKVSELNGTYIYVEKID